MFIGGVLLVGGLLAAVFWIGLTKVSAASNLKSRALTLLIFMGLSGGVYALSGQPDYTAPRLVTADAGIGDIGAALRPEGLGAVEAYGGLVQSQSQNKTEWLDVAQSLRAARRPVEAADALMRAGKLAETATERAALFGAAGETLVSSKGGGVDDEAVAAFLAALEADPNSLGALYYLGRQGRLKGDEDTARAYWSQFLTVAPEAHPLVTEVRGDLALIGGAEVATPRIAPVLTDEMVAQFEGLDAEQRQARIASMLERVENRLEQPENKSESGEWRELARAYVRVGNLESAATAYQRAIDLAPDDLALRLEYQQIEP